MVKDVKATLTSKNEGIPAAAAAATNTATVLILQSFYSSLDFVRDYPGEPVPERQNQSGFYRSRRQ